MYSRFALAAALVSASCAVRPFRVMPAAPEYLLQAPDGTQARFSDVQRRYYRADLGGMSLGPHTRLRVENAYYEKGAPKRGVTRYVGSELAFYDVRPRGLHLSAVPQHLAGAPDDQLPVEQLIRPEALRFRRYRLFLQIAVSRNSDRRGAVLIGAGSPAELDRLSAQLTTDPGAVCNDRSPHCTIFPEACSVSIEIEVTVNGVPRSVLWTTSAIGLVGPKQPPDLRIMRLVRGRQVPVLLVSADPDALRLPLLPGDRVDFTPQ